MIRALRESPAILMKNHGVVTVGRTAEAAVQAAVTVEDVATTVYYATQLGTLEETSPQEVARAHRRYVEIYGQ